MKLYNRELNEIENPERYDRIQNIVKRQIEFLTNTYGIDEKMLQDRAEGLAVIERRPTDETYFVEYNGKKQEFPNNKSAAFAAIKNQEYDGTKWNFENGIYISDINKEHSIIHELFHFLSQKQQMEFDENDIGYTKSGILISGYNREDKLVDKSLCARGLNEGITELLAMKMNTGVTMPQGYAFQVYMADILIGNQHNSLMKAYFSDDKEDFKKFLDEFDKRQNTISSQKLIEMSTTNQTVVDTQILKGCMEYALSFCKNMDELNEEKNRLLPIFKAMLKNDNIEFDMEQFDLKQFFNKSMLQKKEEIEGLAHNTELLDSAIEATEKVTKNNTIREEVMKLNKIEKNRDANEKAIE